MYIYSKIVEFAQRTPEAPAIIHDGAPITYSAFRDMISALRGVLSKRRLRPGSIAIVRIDTLPVAWIADIALNASGLTTLAIRSEAELAVCAELDVGCFVTWAAERHPTVDPAIAPAAARLVLEQADWSSGPPRDADDEATGAGGHILLTSATTGHFKMILTPNETEESAREAGFLTYVGSGAKLGEDLAALRVNMLYFGLWTAAGYNTPPLVWSRGGAAIYPGVDLVKSLAVPGLTHLLATPAFLNELLAAPESAFPRDQDLQIVTVGGTPSLFLVTQIHARLTRRVATALGSTESGAWAITQIQSLEDLRWHRLEPSRVVEVVDEDDRPLPPGALGEVRVLLTGGITGYLNDPEATAAFFRNGYFYPGDLGVLDGAGRLALYGRVTEVLNVQGDKLPAGPLEESLRDALGVNAVCAFSEMSANHTEELHVAIETATPIDASTLEQVAKAHVKGFPGVDFHFVEQLPRNHMGKVERLKLKQQLIAKGAI